MSITPSWCPGAPRKRACALDPCPAAQSPLPARKLHALLRCMLCGHAILHVPTETQVRIGQKTFLLQAAPLAGSPGAGADNSAPPTLLAPASLALPAPAPVPRPLARVEAAPRALATTGSAALTLADPLRTYRHAHARKRQYMLTQAYAGTCRHTQSYAPLMHAASACACTREHYACGRAHSRIRIRICKRMRMHTFSCARTRMRMRAYARVCVRHACYHAADTDQYCQSCPLNTSSAAGSGSRLACVCNAGVLRNPVTLCRRPRLLSLLHLRLVCCRAIQPSSPLFSRPRARPTGIERRLRSRRGGSTCTRARSRMPGIAASRHLCKRDRCRRGVPCSASGAGKQIIHTLTSQITLHVIRAASLAQLVVACPS